MVNMEEIKLARHPGSCFNLVDFCPDYRRRPQAWFLTPKYQTLSELFDRINAWLADHSDWKVVSCESILFDPDTGFGNEISVSIGSLARKAIRGIRLWLTPSKEGGNKGQKLGCINMVPKLRGNQVANGQKIDPSSQNKLNEYETVQEMVDRANNLLRDKPIQGRIISVETVFIPVTGTWDIDTESSEYYRDASQYVQTLRIYHEQGDPIREEIGLRDFIPSSISWDSPLAPPNYESFASLFTRASQWFRDQASSHRYLNCQSVEMPLLNRAYGAKSPINSDSSLLSPKGSEFSLKFIRLAYTSPVSTQPSEGNQTTQDIVLNCKIFVPTRLKSTNQYETVAATKRKMEAWLTITGARVLSAETSIVKLSYCNSSIAANVDSCLTSIPLRANDSHFILTYRVYLDGHYIEPPTRLLPTFNGPPTNDEPNCTIT